MTYVTCPNCRTQSPAWQSCANCRAHFETLLPECSVEPSLEKTARGAGYNNIAFMDPRLHLAVEQINERKIVKLRSASTPQNWVTVIARVTDPDEFEKLPDVEVKTKIPPLSADDKDQTTILTGRMPADRAEELRKYKSKYKYIISLKVGQRLRPQLERTREASQVEPKGNASTKAGIFQAQSQDLSAGNGGEGVIVGFVDFGLDFMHRNFRHSDPSGSTRILALWNQAAATDSKSSVFGYGRLYEMEEIDRAIKNSNDDVTRAYQALDYAPPEDSLFQVGAHGTYVADVAVGNGGGTGVSGIAPRAEIVFVESASMPDPPLLDNSFGDSAQLLEAVKFIFDYAEQECRPCVVNISLGTSGGPHDGSTLVEMALDRLIGAQPNRAVVIAAGNDHKKRLHASGLVTQGGQLDLKWRIPKDDPTTNELEVWYSANDRFTAEVIDPAKVSIGKAAPGGRLKPRGSQGRGVSLTNRLDDPNNHDNTINLTVEPGMKSGVWTLRLHGESVKDGRFHAWIERDETGQSRFVTPRDKSYVISDECTLSSIACGRQTVVVGSFNAAGRPSPLGDTSSSGPTRDCRRKPDLSAPGELVMAALSRSLVLRNRISGTSLAAPVVTGAIALMLAEARAQGFSLSAAEILRILRFTAQKGQLKGQLWHPHHGFGRVSVRDAIEEVRAIKREQ